jgi:hypothetical protein
MGTLGFATSNSILDSLGAIRGITRERPPGRGWHQPGADLRRAAGPGRRRPVYTGAPEADRFSMLVAALERAETYEPRWLYSATSRPSRHLAYVGSI